jgi:antitoxin HicB
MAGKTIEEYLSLPYKIEVFRDDDEENPGWVARVVELPGCITQGDTFEELGEMIVDAMRGWIETAIADSEEVPEPRQEESYSGKFVVRVPKSLHRELSECAGRDGVSLNLFVSTALGKTVGQTIMIKADEELNKEMPSMVNWPRLSEAARRLMIARGLSLEVQSVEEQLFANWVDDYLDQAQAALEMTEYQQALQYIRTLRQGLDQLCDQSPLVKTYCRAAVLLEGQIVATSRMLTGIMEQGRIQQRVLAQVRESAQTSSYEREETGYESFDPASPLVNFRPMKSDD